MAYVAGSLTSGGAAGALFGWVGAFLLHGRAATGVWWIGLGALSLVLAFQEFGWLRVGTVEWRRQTVKIWFHRLGPTEAAWWWGMDLGSGLTTRVAFPIYWLLVVGALLSGGPAHGALVLCLFGFGRSVVTVILPPLFDLNAQTLARFVNSLMELRPLLHRWHGFGLLTLAMALLSVGVIRR